MVMYPNEVETKGKKITWDKTLTTTYPMKTVLKNAGFSFSCGRRKIELFEYDDVIHHTAQAL